MVIKEKQLDNVVVMLKEEHRMLERKNDSIKSYNPSRYS